MTEPSPQPHVIPRLPRHLHRSTPTLLALAQNNVTATDNNNRPANHRARARHIRKYQVTDQAGPENINILELEFRGQYTYLDFDGLRPARWGASGLPVTGT